MLHTKAKLVSEICTDRLATVQISMDEINSAKSFQAKLSPTYDIVFTRQQNLQIIILNVRCAHVNMIQGGICQKSSHAFSGYYTRRG